MKADSRLSVLFCLAVAVVLSADGVLAATFDVRDFGAKGDGLVKNTVEIQKAVDACSQKGGGGRIAITKNADDATEKYMAEHGALPEKRKILGLDGFHAEYPDVTVDVSSAGGAACAGTFAYVDNTRKGLSVIVR